MQRLYCGLADFSTINRHDTHITIYGNSANSTVTKKFIENLSCSVDSLSVIELEQITIIEDKAFENLQASRFELILPDTLEYIGDYAFTNCTAMNTIIIPSSVTHLGKGVFYGCPSLDYIYFREDIKIFTIPEQFCSGCALKGMGIAYNNGTFTSNDIIEFPKSITKVEKNAFKNCSSMGHRIITGDNITNIGDYAFYGTAITDIEFGIGLSTGRSQNSDKFEDSDYDTDRDITTPYTLYLSSKRQFRYAYFEVEEDAPAGYIHKLNKDEYEEDGKTYTYKLSDDNFKFCLQNSHLMVFKNGCILPPTYYYLHSIINTPIDDVGIVFNVPLSIGDRIDIFYVTNDLKHLETDYYDIGDKERYVQNGMIILNPNGNEVRVMGRQLYPNDNRRTNYIKLRSPLYAISSKHSTLVFLNGKKIRFDELEDISDTIMSINTDYSNTDMNAVRLEVINHLDTQDIIEQLYINDGLCHDESIFKNTFRDGLYKNTKIIKNFSLTDLESYAERTLLDKILNDLSDENLNKLFYEYDTAKGPMTHYDESKMKEPDFINKDEIIQNIIDKYYVYPTSEEDYLYSIDNGEANIIKYVGDKNKIAIPTTLEGVKVVSLSSTAFEGNETINKVIIPEGIEYLS